MKKAIIGLFVEDRKSNATYTEEMIYSASIEQSGGVALILPYDNKDDVLNHFVSVCDGFFFTGGADIEPSRYGTVKHSKCGQTDRMRDEFEFASIEKILKTEKPILGIGRGMQLINIALGGTLYQDISSEKKNSISHRQHQPKFSPSHKVNIVSNTPLHRLVGKKYITANSFHHQGINILGKKLSAMAMTDDGLIEAICFEGKRYIRAYQWHPERLYVMDSMNKLLFDDFIEACNKNC